MKTKGNRNEPSFLPHIANEVSMLLDIDKETLIDQTYNNAIEFFN
ncbi:TatD family hydrolase [Gammaproteobacteria bacterium]|nr:TatD family hydrolase [Gammaproteobacteria bacterium]